jgi:hypothetical protein
MMRIKSEGRRQKAEVGKKGTKARRHVGTKEFTSAFCLLTSAFILSGCASTTSPTTQPVVSTTRQAAAIAVDYCQQHDLDWGQPAWIIQEMDGYYVEFGDAKYHPGLTVGYDGVVRP